MTTTTTRLVQKDILTSLFRDDEAFRKNAADLPNLVRLNSDSRIIIRGDIFIALHGDTHDGHQYIDEAHKKGAIFCIANLAYKNKNAPKKSLPIIFVDDTLKTFSDIARLHLQKLSAHKVAITGSNGKTTTKEMVKAALIKVFGPSKIYASSGNKNNHFGVPLSALEVSSDHDVAIFELGMNHAGEITSLASIIDPQVGIITTINHAHSGNFKDGIDGVAHAKGELFTHIAKTKGCAIINVDDERVIKEAQKHQWTEKISFGVAHNADIRLVEHSPFSVSTHSQTVVLDVKGEAVTFSIPLPGSHHAHNAAAALAIAMAFRVPIKDAALGLMDMEKTRGRMSISRTKEGILIIDDGYNANLSSMTAGILASRDFLATRRIAVIGAMGELGKESIDHHHRLGQLLSKYFDHLFICGEEAYEAVVGAQAMGFSQNRIVYKNCATELIAPLKKLLKPGDVVFIKGSLSANMRAIVEALLIS